jgi:hypothetical protein
MITQKKMIQNFNYDEQETLVWQGGSEKLLAGKIIKTEL